MSNKLFHIFSKFKDSSVTWSQGSPEIAPCSVGQNGSKTAVRKDILLLKAIILNNLLVASQIYVLA